MDRCSPSNNARPRSAALLASAAARAFDGRAVFVVGPAGCGRSHLLMDLASTTGVIPLLVPPLMSPAELAGVRDEIARIGEGDLDGWWIVRLAAARGLPAGLSALEATRDLDRLPAAPVLVGDLEGIAPPNRSRSFIESALMFAARVVHDRRLAMSNQLKIVMRSDTPVAAAQNVEQLMEGRTVRMAAPKEVATTAALVMAGNSVQMAAAVPALKVASDVLMASGAGGAQAARIAEAAWAGTGWGFKRKRWLSVAEVLADGFSFRAQNGAEHVHLGMVQAFVERAAQALLDHGSSPYGQLMPALLERAYVESVAAGLERMAEQAAFERAVPIDAVREVLVALTPGRLKAESGGPAGLAIALSGTGLERSNCFDTIAWLMATGVLHSMRSPGRLAAASFFETGRSQLASPQSTPTHDGETAWQKSSGLRI